MALWGNLPEDLLEEVLIRLSRPDILGCRLLSNGWNSRILAIASASFTPATGLVRFVPNGEFDRECLTVLNHEAHRWDKRSLSFLSDGGVHGQHSLVAADGGLLCFRDSLWESFVICNALSKQWKALKLPTRVLPASRGFMLVGLVVERGNYKLVVAAGLDASEGHEPWMMDDGQHPHVTTYVYDSASMIWGAGPSIPCMVRLDLKTMSQRAVVVDGKLSWSIIEKNGLTKGSTHEVLTFDLGRSQWRFVSLGGMFENVVVVGGEVRLISLQHLTKTDDIWSYDISEAEDVGTPVMDTSARLGTFFRVKGVKEIMCQLGKHFCLGQGPWLYILYQLIPREPNPLGETEGWRVFCFNFFTGTRYWLQFNTDLSREDPLSWWTLVPSLTAMP